MIKLQRKKTKQPTIPVPIHFNGFIHPPAQSHIMEIKSIVIKINISFFSFHSFYGSGQFVNILSFCSSCETRTIDLFGQFFLDEANEWQTIDKRHRSKNCND